MKVSYNWLKELVDLNDITFEQLVKDLSLYSIEVEGTEVVASGSNIIVAYVEEKIKHPNADKLSVCQVNTGKEILQVVCGAPNVDKGQKVMLALPGAVLPGGTIKVSKIRDVESNGMLCSLAELGLESKYIPEEYAHGIYLLDDKAPLGEDALHYLCLDDKAIELGLTPNRMDLLAMRGVANDVSAMYNLQKFDEYADLEEKGNPAANEIKVELATEKCLTYYAKVVKNVKITESPNFIKARLIASGIRPINNVVDITNYILMLFGQPLHAFDQDVLGRNIVVRLAKDGEKTVTLDNIERTLNSDDIVITDGKEITCIAGVMGCKNTEVTENTTNLVLEAAVFNPLSVRKTSAKLGLRSESSVRFERGVDLNQTLTALEYACYLLTKYAGGTVCQGNVHQGISHLDDKVIPMSEEFIKAYLGITINEAEIEDICHRLDFNVERSGDELLVKVPNRRMDVTIKQDLVEEIGRIHGYSSLNNTLPLMDLTGSLTPHQKMRRLIKHTLADAGLNEVISYTLVNAKDNQIFKTLYPNNYSEICLLNPISEERKNMRMGLIPALISILEYNRSRKMKNVHIFEIGERYYFESNQKEPTHEYMLAGVMSGEWGLPSWQGKTEVVDFYRTKGILELLARRLGLKLSYQKLANPAEELHPERSAGIYLGEKLIGYIAEVHPAYAHAHDLDDTYVFELMLEDILAYDHQTIMFKQISKVPTVDRDIALVMKETQSVGEIVDAIYKTDKQAISNVSVFDIYKGDKLANDEKSVAIRVTIASDETLTEEIISSKMQKIIKMAEFRYQAKLRA